MRRLFLPLIACWFTLSSLAYAQTEPADMLAAHFAAITAEKYTEADQYFSTAFLRAFKGDVAALNEYYLARHTQLAPGYSILATEQLGDTRVEAVVVTVEFADPHPEAPVGVTERMYYYLLREKAADGAPGRDADGYAWRIEVYDAIRFDTLAEARQRPYLYTSEAWNDDAGAELRSRQGIFRIQLALGAFYLDHGQFPFRLLGGDNRRDELIAGGYINERYPACGFAERPMRAVEFGERSSGDFSYYSVDADGDGAFEGYWLLLHGKVPEHYYFEGRDTIYLLNAGLSGSQQELADQFMVFWMQRGAEQLALTTAFVELSEQLEAGLPLPAALELGPALPSLPAVEPPAVAAGAPPDAGVAAAPVIPATEPAAVDATPAVEPAADEAKQAAQAAAVDPALLAQMLAAAVGNSARRAAGFDPVARAAAQAALDAAPAAAILRVFSFGF